MITNEPRLQPCVAAVMVKKKFQAPTILPAWRSSHSKIQHKQTGLYIQLPERKRERETFFKLEGLLFFHECRMKLNYFVKKIQLSCECSIRLRLITIRDECPLTMQQIKYREYIVFVSVIKRIPLFRRININSVACYATYELSLEFQ